MPKQSRKHLRPARATPRQAERAPEASAPARPEGVGEADPAQVRDAARPLVERALLALHVEPQVPSRLARFVTLLERSRLPLAHRDALIDRLRDDQAAADAIAATVRGAFGDDGPALRDALIRSLEELERALDGAPGAGTWALSDGREVALPAEALDGPLPVRAEALVGALADAVHAPLPESARPSSVGAAFARLCGVLPLLLPWEEEDEELDAPDPV